MGTTYSLDQFLADTRATIKTRGYPAGPPRYAITGKLINQPGSEEHLGGPGRTWSGPIGHDPENAVQVLGPGQGKGGHAP